MSKAFQNIDWDLLNRQKQVLTRLQAKMSDESPDFEALGGLVDLLDAIQDEAVEQGRLTSPNDTKGESVMTIESHWRQMAAEAIYEAYPDRDVLPIEPPGVDETIGAFAKRAEDAGDTLFLFLCREANDEINIVEYLARLDRAIRDIQTVRDLLREDLNSWVTKEQAVARERRPSMSMRLSLGDDWIELGLSYPNAQGLRTGTVTSSLRTDKGNTPFDGAIEAIESMVLGHACVGIEITEPRYVEGICRCLVACAERL